jgi:hypothetical protein
MNYTEELALVLTAYNDADYPRVERYNRIKTIHHIAWAAGDPIVYPPNLIYQLCV